MKQIGQCTLVLCILLISCTLSALDINWLQAFNSQGSNAVPWTSCKDPQGNIYIGGYFQNQLHLGNYTLQAHGPRTDYDLFIAKFDHTGRPLWLYGGGGGNEIEGGLDKVTSIKFGTDGFLYVCGQIEGEALFSDGTSVTSTANTDFYVAKFTTSGQKVWMQHFGAVPENDTDYCVSFANNLDLDATNNIYIAASYYRRLTIGGETLVPSTSLGRGNAVITKLSPQGEVLWAHQANSSYFSRGYTVSVDQSGNCYFGGDYNETLTCNDATYNASVDWENTFLMKYSTEGQFIWSKGFIGTEQNVTAASTVASNGHLLTVGSYLRGITVAGQTFTTPQQGYDCYVASWSPNGSLDWLKPFTGDGYQYIRDIELDSIGNIIVGGYCHNGISIPPMSLSGRSTNAWMAKLSPSGEPTGLEIIPTLGNVDAMNFIIHDNSILVIGMYQDSTYFNNTTLYSDYLDCFMLDFNFSSGFASISGQVRDLANNHPLSDAEVKVGDTVFYTDANGNYSGLVPPGDRPFTCRKSGYESFSIGSVSFTIGGIVSQDVTLETFDSFNAPPSNFSLSSNYSDLVQLQWQAPHQEGQELCYDDWCPEFWGTIPPATYTMAMVGQGFTVDTTSNLSAMRILLRSPYSTSQNLKFFVVKGTNHLPDMSQILWGPYNLTYESTLLPSWVTIPVNIQIAPYEDFFLLCARDNDNTVFFASDQTQPDNFALYTMNSGASWYPLEQQDIVFHALLNSEVTELSIKPTDIDIASLPQGDFSNTKQDVSISIPPIQKVYHERPTVTGYRIYRNDQLIHTFSSPDSLCYQDCNQEPGEYHYSVTSMYGTAEGGMTLRKNIVLLDPNLNPPYGLNAQLQNNNVRLDWSMEPGIGYWAGWCGEVEFAFGTANPAQLTIATRFLPEDLAMVNGSTLSQVAFFKGAGEANYTLKIWEGGDYNGPGELIVSQDIPNTINNSWNFVKLLNPPAILSEQELYVGFTVDLTSGYPLAMDAGPMEIAKGGWINDGNGWFQISQLTSYFRNWCIRALFDTSQGTRAITTLTEPKTNPLINHSIAYQSTTFENPQTMPMRNVTGFQIFRNGTRIAQLGTGQMSYIDIAPNQGTQTYTVKAIYQEGISEDSNSAVVHIGLANDEDNTSAPRTGISNYPNPFNPTTRINYSLVENSPVKISVYNQKGELIRELVNENKTAGSHNVLWDGCNSSQQQVASGIYLFRMSIKNKSYTRKALLLK